MTSGIQADPTPNSAKPRLEFIDALRGFGALYILVYHVALIPNPPLNLPGWARTIIMNGGTGVTLFFLLSAFTLMLSARRHAAESHSTKDFYLRRFFRIAPLFYVWIVVSLIRDKLYGGSHSLVTVLLSMVFGFNLIPGEHQGFVWASWVLGVEMLFYLIFPLLHRYVDGLWKCVVFFFAAAAFFEGFSYAVIHYTAMDPTVRHTYLAFNFFQQLPVFAIGMAIFFVYDKYIQNRNRRWGWGLACIACAVFLSIVILEHRVPVMMNYLYLVAIAYGLFILGLSIAPLKILVNPVSRFWGEIGYSVYLNHPTIVWGFTPLYLYLYSLQIPRTFQFGAAFLLTLGVVTILSVATYQFIEKPGIRLGGWIIRRMRQTAPAGPASQKNKESALMRMGRMGVRRVRRSRLIATVKSVLAQMATGVDTALEKIFQGGWRHLALWGGIIVYMLVAPGMYDEFLAAEGMPLPGSRSAAPSNDPRIMSHVYNLVAQNDPGLFRLQGWAFLDNEEKYPAGRYERQVVLSHPNGMSAFTTETTRSFDVDLFYKALGMDLTRAGFAALINKDGLDPGMYSAGIFLTDTSAGESAYSFLKACLVKTPNQLILKDLTDPDCYPMGAGFGKPVGADVALPGETAQWKMWVEKMDPAYAGKFYQIEGWAFLTVDKSVPAGGYDRRMVLRGPQGNLVFASDVVIRQDVDEYFKSEGMKLLMSGFTVLIDPHILAEGVYGIGWIFTDKHTGAAYYVDAQRCLLRTESALALAPNGSQVCRQPYLAGALPLVEGGERGAV
jgi:peptidoglycan/LPS O-acetylase OafA/YrhL